MSDRRPSPLQYGRPVSRRAVAAAWTLPVVAVAMATPAAAASGEDDLGAFRLVGTCGAPPFARPAFTLTAGPERALPVGTIVRIFSSGIGSIGAFTVENGSAQPMPLSATAYQFTLTAPLPEGATMTFRSSLSTSRQWRLDASVELPEGFVGSGSTGAAAISSTFGGCSAS